MALCATPIRRYQGLLGGAARWGALQYVVDRDGAGLDLWAEPEGSGRGGEETGTSGFLQSLTMGKVMNVLGYYSTTETVIIASRSKGQGRENVDPTRPL